LHVTVYSVVTVEPKKVSHSNDAAKLDILVASRQSHFIGGKPGRQVHSVAACWGKLA